jgi:hypothetical protein
MHRGTVVAALKTWVDSGAKASSLAEAKEVRTEEKP